MHRQARLALGIVTMVTVVSTFFYYMDATQSQHTISYAVEADTGLSNSSNSVDCADVATRTADDQEAQMLQEVHSLLHSITELPIQQNATSNLPIATNSKSPSEPSLEHLMHLVSTRLQHVKDDGLGLSRDSVTELTTMLNILQEFRIKVPTDSLSASPVQDVRALSPQKSPDIATDDQVRKVLLLSYQRTGSSFIGNLFHPSRNPDVFYIYEPLDQVYAAMYGSDMGWTVPTDIRVLPDGKERKLPERELEAMDLILDSIFSCSMSRLPVAMLIHQFWYQFREQMDSLPFSNCLRLKGINIRKTLDTCRSPIKRLCSGRFSPSNRNLDLCQKALYNNGTWTSTVDELQRFTTSQNAELFMKYHNCIASFKEKSRQCAEIHFDKPCKNKRVRAAKTVRATMETAERLLKKTNNLKVVHSFRDPRGAVRSRSVFNWAQGRYDGPVLSKLAKTYCGSVLQDHRLAKQLDEQYTGKISRLIYDDYVNRPLEVAEEIIRFCELGQSEAVKKWLSSVTKGSSGTSATAKATKWQGLFKAQQVADINGQCREFFYEIPFDWHQQ